MALYNAFVLSLSVCVLIVSSEIIFATNLNHSDSNVANESVNVFVESPVEVTTYRYPTATWSAPSFEMKRKKMPLEMAKLYLFKPSPFLKPPFTEGDVGASISGIEDGVNVNGHRRGTVKWHQKKKLLYSPSIPTVDNGNSTERTKYANVVDSFLEEALMNYIRSRNLTDEFGTISVEMFSEALRRITEERKTTAPPYDKNIGLRKKFRDDLLTPKKPEAPTTPSGLLEKQYQRRLKKTWEIIHENISIPSRSASLDQRENLLTVDFTTAASTTTFRSETPRPEVTEATTVNNIFIKWNTIALPSPGTKTITHFSSVSSTTPSSLLASERSKVKSKTSRGKKKYRDSIKQIKEDNRVDDGELKLSVAETVYYQPRKTHFRSFNYEQELDFSSIPGEPNKDYPMLSSPPSTGFRCPNLHGGGPRMMADRKARCQVFYICTGDGPAAPMLCPNGTLFNENVLVCDWWYNVDC